MEESPFEAAGPILLKPEPYKKAVAFLLSPRINARRLPPGKRLYFRGLVEEGGDRTMVEVILTRI